jgi:hypothetical protein
MIKTNFVSKSISVILGEYCATKRTNLPSSELQQATIAREYYLNYVTKTAIANGLVPIYWDIESLVRVVLVYSIETLFLLLIKELLMQ